MVLPNRASLLRGLQHLLPRPAILQSSPLPALIAGGPPCLLHTSLSSSSPSPTSLRAFKRPERPPRRDQQETQRPTGSGAPTKHLSAEQMEFLRRELGDPESWQLVYRLKAMPFVQAFSRLKLLLTGILVVGSPLSVVCCHYNVVTSEFCWFLFGAATFSFCTLCVFSHFSTKLVGVISLHKDTGLLRLGLLSFWGHRRNLLIRPDQLLPPGDLTAVDKRTVRLAVIGDAQTGDFPSPREFYLSAVSGQVSDRQLFAKYLGEVWQER
ncbi:hypothetical protein SprV_0301035400 [Sparganum proliferum]